MVTQGQLLSDYWSAMQLICLFEMTASIRAREPEQKADRRRAILDAALRLWQESTYEQFTMGELANRLGVAKGTLYLYFETKEDLFQSLLDSMVTGWANELSTWLGALRSPTRPKEVVAVIGRSLKGRPQMLRLIPVLAILPGREEGTRILAERPRPELDTAARALSSVLPQLKASYGTSLSEQPVRIDGGLVCAGGTPTAGTGRILAGIGGALAGR